MGRLLQVVGFVGTLDLRNLGRSSALYCYQIAGG